MGATASLQPEVFTLAKDEYEKKKAEGVSDEELFNHMKTFIETKLSEAPAEPAKEDGEATAPTPDHPVAGETTGTDGTAGEAN
ncbi:hypothetical protein EON65_06770 [archaeon]|nr:MAG: hypothetical protein EON65_06770 [archaeon]